MNETNRRAVRRGILPLAIVAACTVAYGCATPPDSAATQPKPAATATSPGPVVVGNQPQLSEPVSTVIDARPAAIVNGRAVTWGELRPLLNEAAGTQMLRELILDRNVHEAAAEAGIIIGPNEIAAERRLLLESLDDDADTAMRLLDTLRERQGLGRVRFERLLARNAALRAMVRGGVEVRETDVTRLHQITYGPKRQARLMVTRDLQEARAALGRIEAGELFVDVAVEMSVDSSAPRGGLLEPIALADPSYPESMRLALWALKNDEVSAPILVDGQYALLQFVREIPAQDVDLESVRAKLMRQARLNGERIMMDRLARRLTAEASVTIFDEALNDAWRRERSR